MDVSSVGVHDEFGSDLQNYVTDPFTAASGAAASRSYKRGQLSLVDVLGNFSAYRLAGDDLVRLRCEMLGQTDRAARANRQGKGLVRVRPRSAAARRRLTGAKGGPGRTVFPAITAPSSVALQRRGVGEQGLFERVVEAMLAMKRLGQEIGLRDISLLAENHVDGAAGVDDEHLGLVRGVRDVHGCRSDARGGEARRWFRAAEMEGGRAHLPF